MSSSIVTFIFSSDGQEYQETVSSSPSFTKHERGYGGSFDEYLTENKVVRQECYADELAHNILDYFNDTRKPNEEVRDFVRIVLD